MLLCTPTSSAFSAILIVAHTLTLPMTTIMAGSRRALRSYQPTSRWLQERHRWPGLTRTRPHRSGSPITHWRITKTTTETAYFLLSAPLSPERLGEVVRSHWGVENRLHWVLNVVMNEDQIRSRRDNSPYNLAILRHMALNLMHKDRSNVSLRGKFNLAAWRDDFLVKFLAQA